MIPKMILFDYGETLVHETTFDSLRGAQALLDAAVKNPDGVTARDIVHLLDGISRDVMAEFQIQSLGLRSLEIPAVSINNYAFQYLGLEYDLPPQELEWIFWNNATPAEPTGHILELLNYLSGRGIATGVVSNIMDSGATLKRRLDQLLPGHEFSFVLASCDYVFRKPHPRIFDMALKLAKLPGDSIWFCGDNLRCDVEGAHAAGMRPFWYTRHLRTRPQAACPDYAVEIQDWRELIGILEKEA